MRANIKVAIILIFLVISNNAILKEYQAEDYLDIGIPVTNIHASKSNQKFSLFHFYIS